MQNLSVALSAIVVVLFLRFDAQLHGAVRHSLEGVIIALAVVGSLASTAYRVAVEKDWIVVISDGNASKLASEFLQITVSPHSVVTGIHVCVDRSLLSVALPKWVATGRLPLKEPNFVLRVHNLRLFFFSMQIE